MRKSVACQLTFLYKGIEYVQFSAANRPRTMLNSRGFGSVQKNSLGCMNAGMPLAAFLTGPGLKQEGLQAWLYEVLEYVIAL